MIHIGPYAFEIIESKIKTLKLKSISKEQSGPYRIDKNNPDKLNFSRNIFNAHRESTLKDLNRATKKMFNEGYYMKKTDIKRLEAVSKQYKFEDMVAWFKRYWDDMHKTSLENTIASEAKNRPNIEHENNKLIDDLKEEVMMSDLNTEMKQARIRYLKKQNANLSSHARKIEKEEQLMVDRDYDGWWIDSYKEMSGYEKITGKIRSNEITIKHLEGKYSDKVVVTDDMIESAKKVPFNKLLKLEAVGGKYRCKCPFHNEATASFYIFPDTNRGHCYGCGKNVDTIQFLVEKQGIKFNKAVLMLLSY